MNQNVVDFVLKLTCKNLLKENKSLSVPFPGGACCVLVKDICSLLRLEL